MTARGMQLGIISYNAAISACDKGAPGCLQWVTLLVGSLDQLLARIAVIVTMCTKMHNGLAVSLLSPAELTGGQWELALHLLYEAVWKRVVAAVGTKSSTRSSRRVLQVGVGVGVVQAAGAGTGARAGVGIVVVAGLELGVVVVVACSCCLLSLVVAAVVDTAEAQD